MSAEQIGIIFITIVVGYLLGSINGAQLIHHVFRRLFPRHVTRIGTRIAGTQNVWMQTGKFPALFVLAIDISKGYAAVSAAKLLGLDIPFAFLGGIAAVAGHNWPIFFHFRGGRGVATLISALFAVDPRLALFVALGGQFFTLIRWSGIMPFAVIAGFAYFRYPDFGTSFVLLMAGAAAIILVRRLHAYWPILLGTDRKPWVLKNIVWYDRTEANPPSLREVFNFEKFS